MIQKISVLSAVISLVFILGCAQGNCRTNQKIDAATAEATMKQSTSQKDRIKVFKYDGSLQCSMGKPVSVEVMQKQLGNIRVYSAENKSDGLMRVQMCGSPTGKANVYEIDKNDLAAAVKAGFKEWTYE